MGALISLFAIGLVAGGLAGPAKGAPPLQTRGVQSRPMAAQGALYRRRVALVVGIDDYHGSAWDLSHAEHDATAVASVLQARFAFDTVQLLTGDAATLAGVRAQLDALEQSHPDDLVVVYWAGHGVERESENGLQQAFLVPQDGDPRPRFAPASNLSFVDLRQQLLEQVPARHKLVILDACYSGALTVRGTSGAGDATLGQLTARPVLQVLTAGQADEVVLDGGRGGHSVFSAALLDALENIEDYRTASELAADIQRQVREEAWALGHRQSPDFARLAGSGDVVLVPRGDPQARAPRVPVQRAPASWGSVVPGLSAPELGRPPAVVVRSSVSLRPLAARRVRVADADGIGVAQLDPAQVVASVGATVPVGRWRVDASTGVEAGPDPETPTLPMGTVALGPGAWSLGGAKVGVQARLAQGAASVGEGAGVGLLLGGRRAEWAVDAGLLWPRPGLGFGMRVGPPSVGLLLGGVGVFDVSTRAHATTRPLVGLDMSGRGGLRVALLGEVGWAWTRVASGGVAWVQEPDALAVVGGRASDRSVSGPGVSGEPMEGPGWHGAMAPGPALRVELAWSPR